MQFSTSSVSSDGPTLSAAAADLIGLVLLLLVTMFQGSVFLSQSRQLPLRLLEGPSGLAQALLRCLRHITALG